MRTGQYILAKGNLPAHDIFSWTLTDRPWVLYQWLFEVVVGIIANASGPRSLWVAGFATSLFAGWLVFFLMPRQWLRLRIPFAIACPFAALMLSPPWFFIRPQLVSHLFILVFINAWERFRRCQDWKTLWYLPLVMIVWANCHPLWVFGIAISGAYALVHCLSAFSEGNSKKMVAPGAIILACAAALLVNPYGAGLIGYELYFNSANNFKAVNELKPLWDNPHPLFFPFIAFCLISAPLIIWQARNVPKAGWLLSALGLCAGLSINKLAPVGALLIWPYLGFALAGLRQPLASRAKDSLAGVLHFLRKADGYLNRKGGFRQLLLALIISAACFELRVPSGDYAIIVFCYNDISAMKFLATHPFPNRRIFNDEPTGSLLIYFNLLPVFCDGRVDFYGKDFCQAWMNCVDGEAGWQAYLDQFAVNEIIVRNSTGLNAQLVKSPNWLLCFNSGLRSIYVRNDEMGKSILGKWRSADTAPQ